MALEPTRTLCRTAREAGDMEQMRGSPSSNSTFVHVADHPSVRISFRESCILGSGGPCCLTDRRPGPCIA